MASELFATQDVGKKFDPKDSGRLTEPIVNGYILYSIEAWKVLKYKDDDLWMAYQEDFEKWSEETFKMAHVNAIRSLRDFLRENGVFVNKAKSVNMIKSLMETLDETDQHIWTPPEIQYQLARGPMNSRLITPSIETKDSDIETYETKPTLIYKNDEAKQIPTISPSQQIPFEQNLPSQARLSQPYFQCAPENSSSVPNPQIIKNFSNYNNSGGRAITNLRKSYTQELKYCGADDSLSLKLEMFYDLCAENGITENLYRIALPIMLSGQAHTYYYSTIAKLNLDFNGAVQMLRNQYETEQRQQKDFSEWSTITLANMLIQNSNKSLQECFELMLENLRSIQLRLDPIYQTQKALRDKVINACRSIPECSLACFSPAPSLEGVCDQLRSSIATAMELSGKSFFNQNTPPSGQFVGQNDESQFFTDRRYHGVNKYNRTSKYTNDKNRFSKKCFVCKQPGCWSTKHSKSERNTAYDDFRKRIQQRGRRPDESMISQYVFDYEGEEDEDMEIFETLLVQLQLEDDNEIPETSQYVTSYGEIDGFKAITQLNDQAAKHALTAPSSSTYILKNRYDSTTFQGIMIDTGAAQWSTAGQPQLLALQKLCNLNFNESTAGQVKIHFGIGTTLSIGSVLVTTLIGDITFHIVPSNTPFLLCLKDMDYLKVKFDNLRNVLVQGNHEIPVIRKFGHPFLLFDDITTSLVYSYATECHLSDTELRQLHRRFGHPSARRLIKVLKRSGHSPDSKTVEHLTKYCHFCQLHGKSPGRFKFTIQDDCEFNHSIYVDVMYIENQPILHVIDKATRFMAARWLRNMSAQHTWDMLRNCWIDVYIGPPDVITHDAGSNFASKEFRQNAQSMAIRTNEVPVEAHHSVGLVERYHVPLKRAYVIIAKELKGSTLDKNLLLQMAVKAVNDTAGPNGLVPTLLVFGAYPRITENDHPSPDIIERARVIKEAMKETRKYYATRQVQDALRMRNGPRTHELHSLNLNADVLVWREKYGWTGPFKMLSINNHTCVVDLPSGPTSFRSTAVKPYHNIIQSQDKEKEKGESENINNVVTKSETTELPARLENNVESRPQRRNRRLPERYRHEIHSFLSQKELLDIETSIKLRNEGIITTPGPPFMHSQQKEINSLIANGVFEFIQFDPTTMNNIRLFKSRMVNEVKGKATNTPYEKSRLVIQAYNDDGKKEILTQSPTLQRVSQRIIVAIAPSLFHRAKLYLRDITQAYVQSKTLLNRTILAYPPKEMIESLPKGTIMKVIKPLYGIPEAGTHWFHTYHKHHCEKLSMTPSSYDPCFLISSKPGAIGFVGLQTDDTLFLGDQDFANLEEKELKNAKLIAKDVNELSPDEPLIFNGCKLVMVKGGINLIQKNQADRITLIDPLHDAKRNYLEQRARGAYLATICQPEASYSLSVAAQCQEPGINEISLLNKQLKWQLQNKDRGIRFRPLQLESAKLFVFVDGSFANNKDFSSQIGFVIVLANETIRETDFLVKGNIIHWSSVKCKRVTRSVLASELYAMVHGIDIAIAISTTLNMITKQIGIQQIPIIICTDSYSLYECMVKLGSTKEKRLMIDIMAIRQSYERRELSEMRWINGNDNPADAMTKANATKALKSLIDNGELLIRIEGWVQREKEKLPMLE